MSTALRSTYFLTKREFRDLSTPSDLKGWWAMTVNWSIIIGVFALAIVWSNPATIILGILLLGGRQLGLAILMHDCAHYSLFRSKRLNDFGGHWFCATPMNASVFAYREYHMKHHRHAGTEKDPDRSFVVKYPIEKASLQRKLMRDLTGRTGVRDLWRVMKQFNLAENWRWALFHVLLLSTLTIAGAPLAYLMWWVAELFVYPALTRIRQIGEHGVATNRDSKDARENTSTTLASWWERLIFAPNNVNYHLEHHQFAGVPSYNLPRLHRLLAKRGFHDGYDCISSGYVDVLRRAIRPAMPAPRLDV